jgi:hypothetical protein
MQGRREEENGGVYGTYVEDFRRLRTQQMRPYCSRIIQKNKVRGQKKWHW